MERPRKWMVAFSVPSPASQSFLLRRKIFKEACYTPRIYNSNVRYRDATSICSSITNLAILYASSESRATTLVVLKPVFDLHIASRWRYDRKIGGMSKGLSGKVLMSANGTVYFTSICFRGDGIRPSIATLMLSDAAACHRLRTIAFNTDVFENTYGGPYLWLKILAWICPALEFILLEEVLADQAATALQFIDLEEGKYQALDDKMNKVMAELTNRPSDLRVRVSSVSICQS
ncbi:hypothetical protein IFR05_011828 [Cadophora sp. M221]|nr:hypothetical protein IFR05_011828 [Cadophora sp. M221]